MNQPKHIYTPGEQDMLVLQGYAMLYFVAKKTGDEDEASDALDQLRSLVAPQLDIDELTDDELACLLLPIRQEDERGLHA